MKLKLTRRYKGKTYTVGTLDIDGVYFCDTLEDKVRDLSKEAKVMHRTAIPEGRYRIEVTMSPRFKRELPRLMNVPHFEGILIHRGNDEGDTSGCILVGENKEKGRVINSTKYEQNLVAKLKTAISAGDDVWITIE